jgi:hypothetical protein
MYSQSDNCQHLLRPRLTVASFSMRSRKQAGTSGLDEESSSVTRWYSNQYTHERQTVLTLQWAQEESKT